MKEEKLFYQFYKAIERCFKPGVDKHSYKKSKATKVKIFSYEDRRNIIKTTNLLSNFIEKNYPDIIYIKDITSREIQEFFYEKSKYCSKNTLMNYKYCIKKLEKMVQQELHINVEYISNIKVKTSNNILRDIELSEKHLEILLRDVEQSDSKAVVAIKIAALFGLRVSEICKLKGKDIDIEKRLVHIIDAKGKRSRQIKIESKEQLEICTNIKDNVKDEERVCPLREDSINTYIRRTLLKNNIKVYNEKKTGVHAIRKYYAKRDYIKNIEKTSSEKKAWAQTSMNLGHGSSRKTLINTYVKY